MIGLKRYGFHTILPVVKVSKFIHIGVEQCSISTRKNILLHSLQYNNVYIHTFI